MKTFKRNAVIITVLMFVCLAVYLNWAYNSKAQLQGQDDDTTAQVSTTQTEQTDQTEQAEDESTQQQDQDQEQTQDSAQTDLYYTDEQQQQTADEQSDDAQSTQSTQSTQTNQTMSEYFDSVRLSRSQARDAAVTTLTMVSESESAAQDTIDEALKKISAMAEYSVLESEVESIIKSKGFSDCVVYISDDGVNVTVPAAEEGLSSADVARITDVITSNTDFSTADLTITEVK